ncbi:MAG: YihY/virulence factor BrkB family protein [Eubacteriaceae bacterium]
MFKKLLNSKLFSFIFFLVDDFEATDFLGTCAQMSFYLLMAFFPFFLFLISFVGRFVTQFEDYLYAILKAFLPTLSYDYVVTLLTQLKGDFSSSEPLLVFLSFLFATLAVRAVVTGLNQTYGQTEKRSLLKLWIFSFIFTILFAVGILLVVITYVLTTDLGNFIYTYLKISENFRFIILIFTQIFFWSISTFLFCLIYATAPVNRLKLKDGLPGAIFATFGLNIAFRIFSFFINHSTKYATLYGTSGGLFALLVGIYFICVVINLGGKLNLYWSFYKVNHFL